MIKIGITERGDAGLDFSWRNKIDKCAFSILITKSLNDNFIDNVHSLTNVIVHATITGYGGTALEPNVMTYQESLLQLTKLINLGFDKNKIVLRIDPIIQSKSGEKIVRKVLDGSLSIGVGRVRYSYIDFYGHVVKRFEEAGIETPSLNNIGFMKHVINDYHNISFESCAENDSSSVGCISKKRL